MHLFAALNIVAACFSLILAGLVLRLRPSATLNRWVALWCLVYCLDALCESFIMSATDPSVFWWAYKVSRVLLAALLPLSMALQVVLIGLRGWVIWAVVGPITLVALIMGIRVAFGPLIVTGFHPGPWGNVAILNHENAWSTYDALIVPLYFYITELVTLAWAWIRHPSRLYRAFLWKYLALNAVAIVCSAFGVFAWVTWGLPDFNSVFGLIFSLGMFGLISRYPFLSDNPPSIDAALWKNLQSPVLLLEPGTKVIHASEEALHLFGKPENDLAGRSLSELLGGSGPRLDARMPVDQFWEASVGSKRFALKVTPSLDRFGQVQTWYVRFDPSASDQSQQRFGLSAREWDVARLVIDGLPSKDIGERLFISPGTVKNHLKSVFRKTDSANRADLVRNLLVSER